MPSTGIDRETGRVLRGWDHVVQSIIVIFTTRIGERVMRRTFGSMVLAILGRENLNPSALLRFYAAVIIAIELWEPRFRVTRILFPSTSNSPTKARQGKFGFGMVGQYRPHALQGDFVTDAEEKVL